MNREQMIKDRDAYLAKLQDELASRYSEPLTFYKNPENTKTSELPPDWIVKKNSKKGLTKTKALLTEAQLIHLLKRTKAGVHKQEYDTFKNMDVEEIVDMLLTEEELAPPVNNYNNVDQNIIDPDVAFGETFIDAPYANDFEGERTMAVKTWFLDEIIKPSTSMHSTMWLFWHNHVVTELWAIFNGRFQYRYMKLLHDHSFVNFKELMYKITIDPSMLLYLNGYVNNKDAPDENYGREVQELFCIGKGADANYTEGDVQAAARLLTGWNINWVEAEGIFYEWDHATEDKQFSEFYGNTLIEGKSGAAGAEELQDFIDMIFENNEVAPFICRKIYTYFAFSSIDEWTEENIIQPLAQIFRDNNYDIKPVLQALFTSEHFYDEVNYGAIIKTPVDSLVGWWRANDVQYPFDAEEDIYNRNRVGRSMIWTMSSWGMQLGDPPNVAGWPAFYQYPTYDKTWITTSTIVRRIDFCDGFLWWGFWSENYIVTFDKLEFLKTLDDPGDPNFIIAHMEKYHLGLPISDELKINLKGTLLTGQTEDYYWTNAWNAFIADESNETNRQIVEDRIRNLFRRFYHLAEYQLK